MQGQEFLARLYSDLYASERGVRLPSGSIESDMFSMTGLIKAFYARTEDLEGRWGSLKQQLKEYNCRINDMLAYAYRQVGSLIPRLGELSGSITEILDADDEELFLDSRHMKEVTSTLRKVNQLATLGPIREVSEFIRSLEQYKEIHIKALDAMIHLYQPLADSIFMKNRPETAESLIREMFDIAPDKRIDYVRSRIRHPIQDYSSS